MIAKWQPKQVNAEDAELLGGVNRLACEIHAKPAGIIGFIRVYRASHTGARNAAEDQLRRGRPASASARSPPRRSPVRAVRGTIMGHGSGINRRAARRRDGYHGRTYHAPRRRESRSIRPQGRP